MPAKAPVTKKPTNGLIQTYLLGYNIVSWSGWLYVLVLAISELVKTGGQWEGVFDATWSALQIVQTAALFEVFHSVVGWVRAPFMTTLMQVLSRLLLVWGVNAMFPAIHTHGSYTTMIIAWCIAELVRYSFYAFNLATGAVPSIISWARYNFFLVLYPMGVSSELMMIYQSLPYAKAIHPAYYYGLIVAALTYAPGFPVLFSHMLVQRKKYFKGTTTKKSE